MINILCNGDSFTAGVELLDHLFTDWPGYIGVASHSERDICKDWADKRYSRAMSYFKSYDRRIQAERAAAWPGYFSKFDPNVNVVNIAHGGASITGIANRTILELSTNKSTKFDFVFIQLTGSFRMEFYRAFNVTKQYMNETPLGWIDRNLRDPNEKKIANKYATTFKDVDFSIKYLYALVGLKYAVKGMTGITPIFLGSCTVWVRDWLLDPILKSDIYSKDPMIRSLIDESGILNIADDDIMETTQIKNKFLYGPLNHFEPKCHEEFAKIIYDKYIK